MIAMMNAKYHYLFWRPVTAIDPTVGDHRRLRPRARLRRRQSGHRRAARLAAAPGDAEPPRIPVRARDDHVGDRRGPHPLPRHRQIDLDVQGTPRPPGRCGTSRPPTTCGPRSSTPGSGRDCTTASPSRPARPGPPGRRLRPQPRPFTRLGRTSTASGRASTARPGCGSRYPIQNGQPQEVRWLPPPGLNRSSRRTSRPCRSTTTCSSRRLFTPCARAAPRPPRPPARRGGHRRRVRSRIRDAARRDEVGRIGRVTGIDLSPAMLAVAQTKPALPRAASIDYHQAPADRLPVGGRRIRRRDLSTRAAVLPESSGRAGGDAARAARGRPHGDRRVGRHRAVPCRSLPSKMPSGKWPATSSPIAIAAGRGACRTPTSSENCSRSPASTTFESPRMLCPCASNARLSFAPRSPSRRVATELDALSASRREQLARTLERKVAVSEALHAEAVTHLALARR